MEVEKLALNGMIRIQKDNQVCVSLCVGLSLKSFVCLTWSTSRTQETRKRAWETKHMKRGRIVHYT